MSIRRVGVDLAKNVIHVHGVYRQEKVVWPRQLRRASWLTVLLERVEPGCEIGMEACAGAHHWARKLQAHGMVVKLMAAWSKYSCGFPMVIFQQPTLAFLTPD